VSMHQQQCRSQRCSTLMSIRITAGCRSTSMSSAAMWWLHFTVRTSCLPSSLSENLNGHLPSLVCLMLPLTYRSTC